MRCLEKNTVNKIEENEPEKLKNKLLITDYAKVKKYRTICFGNPDSWDLEFGILLNVACE